MTVACQFMSIPPPPSPSPLSCHSRRVNTALCDVCAPAFPMVLTTCARLLGDDPKIVSIEPGVSRLCLCALVCAGSTEFFPGGLLQLLKCRGSLLLQENRHTLKSFAVSRENRIAICRRRRRRGSSSSSSCSSSRSCRIFEWVLSSLENVR